MSVEALKQQVLEANLDLVNKNLVISTWGNVSGYDEETGLVAIKASGIKYNDLNIEHMVIMDLDGNIVEGNYHPSTDTATHLILYKTFKDFGIHGIAHTHSKYATMWAQSGNSIPCCGTTHADYFYGDIPNTRLLTAKEINQDYEINTGNVIIETMKGRSCREMSAVLVHSHGPFVWGDTPEEAVLHSLILEYIAEIGLGNVILGDGKDTRIQQELADKHYSRKFGANAYYGQIAKSE